MAQLTNSVIICTRNRLDDIQKFLYSLQKQTQLPTELVIVDSSDIPLQYNQNFQKIFASHVFPTTQLTYVHTTPGLPYQRNIGVQYAVGDVLYFFDDDVELQPNYLAAMQQVFSEQPIYSGGMGTVQNIPPRAQLWCRVIRRIFLLGRVHATGSFTWSGMPTHAYGTHAMREVEVLGGCCMAYRASVFKTQQFDEQLSGYAYMEDCDFSRRVSLTSKLFFNPAAQLYHYNSPISRDKVITNRAMFIHNYSYLFFKNFYPYNRLKIICYWWSVLGLFVEALLYRRLDYVQGYWQGLRKYYFY
ncbi:MAG TPA: glycosyltransferase [Candidatus Dependentiae bacterium]|nr:glycosyltransferase [Candidatus Dependentiae bacterium]HRQ63139.1 glycosyltransferase [Candidatus Dependentiae bacterium]